jgi:hypothetical protein
MTNRAKKLRLGEGMSGNGMRVGACGVKMSGIALTFWIRTDAPGTDLLTTTRPKLSITPTSTVVPGAVPPA